ncbi:MAG TPA: S41 family peptidase [Bacteroidales bacterium]|nr:S41 family peptidase [Bacteroidales bacterium]HOS57159.1 S41 family peptidase [Bacteroidales bacterium]HRT12999.1 S41 family peptidase [Bacteroidales bacterium]HXK73357.1 S41 family peptidase [Bacteroidales bacterium]
MFSRFKIFNRQIAIFSILFFYLIFPLKSQNDFEVAKNVDIFITVLKELNAKYADEISVGDLTKTAIDAMLQKLDPYTVYYPESQIEDFKLLTTGQYGGIGALIQGKEGKVLISEPYEGYPAHVAGLRAGDIILKINNQPTEGKTSEDVSNILKGEPGTAITLEIKRVGVEKPMTFKIVRKEIKLPNIPYFGIIGSDVGYIKLDQFTENAGKEVKESFLKLKEQGMQSLILDLRNNGGGLLNEAVNIVNLFVDQNVTIVETKGKIKEQQNIYKTRTTPIDKQIPVVILINELSASASEIVAGALQDLDRGVIIGKKSFGKGLVQNIIPLSYNSSLKITVSKYYIPSGRCVQNIDYFGKDTLSFKKHIPDSLATAYKTKGGRIVYDKGGIEPDITTADTTASQILITLILNNLIFDFANDFRATHDTIATPDKFVMTEELYQQFLNFLKDKNYEYTTETEILLKELKQSAIEENNFQTIENLYQEMEEKIKLDKSRDLIKYKDEISKFLTSEIITRYYYQKGRIIYTLKNDVDIKTAKEILLDKTKYNSILSK